MTPIRLSRHAMNHKHWFHGIFCVGGAQARSRPRWLRPRGDRGKDGRLRCHPRGGRARAVVETFLECAEQGANASRSAVRHRATSRCHRHTPRLSRRPPWAAASNGFRRNDAHQRGRLLPSGLPRSCPIAACASCTMLSLPSKTRFARALLSALGRVSTSVDRSVGLCGMATCSLRCSGLLRTV